VKSEKKKAKIKAVIKKEALKYKEVKGKDQG
jgi:hypothetical protein